jgi:hypothetical protein
MPKTRLPVAELQRRALLEVKKQPGCHNMQEVAINRVTDARAETNWSLCVLAAGAADANTAARAAVHVRSILRRDYDLLADWSAGQSRQGWDLMNHRFTLSIFTMEINGTPTVALQAKRHKDAESLCEQAWLRADLSRLTSNGSPLWDASAIMKVRLATPAEATLYRQATQSTEPSDDLNVVYLVDLDA